MLKRTAVIIPMLSLAIAAPMAQASPQKQRLKLKMRAERRGSPDTPLR